MHRTARNVFCTASTKSTGEYSRSNLTQHQPLPTFLQQENTHTQRKKVTLTRFASCQQTGTDPSHQNIANRRDNENPGQHHVHIIQNNPSTSVREKSPTSSRSTMPTLYSRSPALGGSAPPRAARSPPLYTRQPPRT